MQPSEMTNDELASYIVNTIGGGIFKEYYAEVAARLRKLKVAEDALEKMQTICKDTEYVYGRVICDDALAAIREEGVTDAD